MSCGGDSCGIILTELFETKSILSIKCKKMNQMKFKIPKYDKHTNYFFSAVLF